MPLTRITITVPASLVREADRRARRESRSRSWIVADALRRYVASESGPAAAADSGPVSGTESPAPPPTGLAEHADRARLQQIESALALSPSARLERAEELGALGRARQNRGRREQVIGFDSYEDYYRWKTGRLIGV
ncbi:MAG TPA: ribbon-helix-helix protein, CopG family [Gemmatimonadaceae bacterium]|nr:ribbon-helix-helix protein, CopG family [Gemmatimonadaceae bacterium]